MFFPKSFFFTLAPHMYRLRYDAPSNHS